MTYTEDQLTGWFDKDTKPTRIGVYEVSVYPPGHEDFDPAYSKWDGEKWNKYLSYKDCGQKPIHAAKEQFRTWGGGSDDMYWRGLSQNPNAKPKRSGNKRKVMYVVMSQHIMDLKSSPDSTFECKKNAEDRVAYLKKIADEHQDIWIQKIRFRTPEQD